ncbi:MAG: anaerobic ribonucleoside-triphosphate reductase [Nitrososphaerota archaeon]|nr:ArsR family transcriptional regulator [Candidatus Bathyarchaeota archaeon]MDW8022660.1 anaerobic ribonucleoside-triphosphate reductase [Nitrososphaerota archaeon]
MKAVSSSVRLHILNMLFDRGPLSYTELMTLLKMNPSRDAGRFAYHLKFLLKADLVEADVESKKYYLTELGKMVISVAEEIEKKSLKAQKVLVRTSRYALEEFDANKIADSLIKEADMPPELAQKIAKEAEKRLFKAKTKYLTAPLIREVVNAIIIEKGLEEYRHKLTRLGLPVYDVSSLMAKHGAYSIEEAGKNVLEEYTLLSVLPRDIADAHLSGAIHLHDLSCWVLKPSEVIHDLRFFLKNGLNLEKVSVLQPSLPPPKTLASALTLISNVIMQSAKEIGGAQTLEYFNVFLAPFLKGVEPAKAKEALRHFVFSINQFAKVSLNMELTVPKFLADKPVSTAQEHSSHYEDFIEESLLLASLLLEVLNGDDVPKPLLNIQLTFKMRPETFSNDKTVSMLLEAHRLVSEKGSVYFANIPEKNGGWTVFSASGCRLDADFNGDWEIDTLRTGVLGCATINLPRVAQECGNEKTKFFEILRDRLEMAAQALEIKYRWLKTRDKVLTPFLAHSANGDQYLRLESSVHLISLAGLREAAETLNGKSIYEDENAFNFAAETLKYVSEFTLKAERKREKRLLSSILPFPEASERLAGLDIERYGVSKVRFHGTREKPYYSTFSRITLQDGEKFLKPLMVEKDLHKLLDGGSLTVLELGDAEYEPQELLSTTRKLIENYGIGFFTYARSLTYCLQCRKSWFGRLPKCPSCGAVSPLTFFNTYP